jgi:ATP-dependent DNA helicase DinG
VVAVPSLENTLALAVASLGGERRAGQDEMAQAVSQAMEDPQHLLVQAGTGTGKSLGYLVPAFLHHDRVVIATATLALQNQLVERDIPKLIESLPADADASFAVAKGRSNYGCLHRVRAGVPDDQGALIEIPEGSLGKEVVKLREWAEAQAESGSSGDRDQAPPHTERAWRQISVTHRECLGAAKCPFAGECFVERARDDAAHAHVVVTNHTMLAIDAIEGVPMLPDYSVVVVDEAHELTTRVTQAVTAELGVSELQRAARRAQRFCQESEADTLAAVADALEDAFALTPPGRLDEIPELLARALVVTRDAARQVLSALSSTSASEVDAARTQAQGMVQEVFVTAERMCERAEGDVIWMTEARERHPARLCIAPLAVQDRIRDGLLSSKTVIFTSATLKLGGDFTAIAQSLGLAETGLVDRPEIPSAGDGAKSAEVGQWRTLDVGSPFNYGQQSIVYVAAHLPPPGRHGMSAEVIDEVSRLVDAAGGRTLGLFSSRRAAEQAAEQVRLRLPHLTVLAQGDAQLPELARQFAADPHTCLFGTLSLWQGIDVPGDTCQLVIIDRIPFPRPDDPLVSARQRHIEAAGGNGFMQVAATHAALLLAQGAGRLIRSKDDRGVVAILDPRVVTARYGSFLRASLPAMWMTTDPKVVDQALHRLARSS